MSPRFEEALARLYVDDAAWERFETAPQRLFDDMRLNAEERAALAATDRESLRIARESFRAKRAVSHPKRPALWRRALHWFY